MRKQEKPEDGGNGGDEEPRETERGENREVGSPELEPRPEHDKGEQTEEAIEEEKGGDP